MSGDFVLDPALAHIRSACTYVHVVFSGQIPAHATATTKEGNGHGHSQGPLGGPTAQGPAAAAAPDAGRCSDAEVCAFVGCVVLVEGRERGQGNTHPDSRPSLSGLFAHQQQFARGRRMRGVVITMQRRRHRNATVGAWVPRANGQLVCAQIKSKRPGLYIAPDLNDIPQRPCCSVLGVPFACHSH